jgi:hypothetical protein
MHLLSVLVIAAAVLLTQRVPAFSEDAKPRLRCQDTTFSWQPWLFPEDGDKSAIPFYVGGWFVGFGGDGFNTAIEATRRLPSGTSVVWGPDGHKMLNGPGAGAVAENEFPALWKRFVRVANERGVALSSSGYGPTSASEDQPPELPAAMYVEPGSVRERADVVLSWKPEAGQEPPIEDYWNVRTFPAYSVNGRESGHGPGGFLATLKALRAVSDGSRLRVVNWPAWPLSGRDIGPWMYLFPLEFRKFVTTKRFQLVIECPKDEWPMSANCPVRCRFEWRNFRSAATPHDEVVYLVDGAVGGLGDAGFDAVLKRLRQLPRGAYFEYPQYCLHAVPYRLSARETFEEEDPVPFAHRRNEMGDIVARRGLVVGRNRVLYWPKPKYDDHVDKAMERGWYLHCLLRFAAIVRDGAKPANADLVVSWTQRIDDRGRPTSEAVYRCNGVVVGSGFGGFMAVLKRVASLHDGATVRIEPVRIRTHGPFADAVIIKGQRHFETTGEEPFRGMIDLLDEMAQQKRLRVEVIPDEGEPDHYPGA